jgi:hypothetical protein
MKIGLLLGLAETAFLLLGISDFGLSGVLLPPLSSGSPGLAGFAWFPIIVSFWAGYRLNDLQSAIKALLLSAVIAVSLFLLTIISIPSFLGPTGSWSQIVASIPIYFFFAIVGLLGGYVVADWRVDETPLPKSKWALGRKLEKFSEDREKEKSKRHH